MDMSPLSAHPGRPGRLMGARKRPSRLAPESGHGRMRPEADKGPGVLARPPRGPHSARCGQRHAEAADVGFGVPKADAGAHGLSGEPAYNLPHGNPRKWPRHMAEERTQRRLAAILATDVVGYSRLMGQDEVGTLRALKDIRAEIIRS